MKSLSVWVLIFFLFASAMCSLAFSFATRDIFAFFHISNAEVFGGALRLSSLIGSAIGIILGVFFGIFYSPSRKYVEQCVAEFDKVAWPSRPETKKATLTVIAVSFLASCILGVFDTLFSWISANNLFLN